MNKLRCAKVELEVSLVAPYFLLYSVNAGKLGRIFFSNSQEKGGSYIYSAKNDTNRKYYQTKASGSYQPRLLNYRLSSILFMHKAKAPRIRVHG